MNAKYVNGWEYDLFLLLPTIAITRENGKAELFLGWLFFGVYFHSDDEQ